MAAVRQFLSNLRIWPGPILAVDLITTSRRKRYFALRAFYAVALLFALYVAHSASLIGNTVEINDINAVARFTGAFFGEFAVVQLMAVLLIGPVMAAGTIAQERERRTIEYLYASPLSSMEIIVGKLGGRVMQLLYLVLGGVPVLSLAMLLGGIAPQLLIALTIITLSTILSVTMISIAVSIYTARARDAVIRAYLVFFVLLVMPLAAFTFLSTPYYAWMRPIHEQVVRANPIFTFMEIYTGQSPWIPAIEPWTMIGQLVRNQLLFAVLVLGRAAWVMRRIHLKQSATPVRKARRRGQWFRRPLGDNPMLWKEMYADGSASRVGMLGYVLLAVVLLVVCSITAYVYYESLQTNLVPCPALIVGLG